MMLSVGQRLAWFFVLLSGMGPSQRTQVDFSMGTRRLEVNA